jgi:hypothetical protein
MKRLQRKFLARDRVGRVLTVVLGLMLFQAEAQEGSSGLCSPAMVGTNADSLTANLANPGPAVSAVKSGAVCFRFTVDESGKVLNAGVFKAMPKSKALASFVEEALRKSRFQPAVQLGKTVGVTAAGTALLIIENGKPMVRASLTLVPEDVAARVNSIDPQMIFNPSLSPRYPDQALRQGRTGRLEYSATVDLDGKVETVKIISDNTRAPHVFQEPVLDYARKSKYVPGWRYGRAVGGVYESACVFELQ